MSPPTLLGLPREIRDMIWEHLRDTATSSGDPLPLTKLPSGTRRYTNGMHSLLRVDRLLREDALDYIKKCETYVVSQRYRAFAGFQRMTPWRVAPIPTRAKRMYLRIYVAGHEGVARPVVRTIDKIQQEALSARMQGNSWRSSCPKIFHINVTSILQNCLELEDLVLELALRRQDTPFGRGSESAEFLETSGGLLEDMFRYEMEHAVRELPALRRYAFLGEGYETRLMRRNAGKQWIPACLIPQCVDTCHCFESFNTTCVEDAENLLGNLIPRSYGQWMNVSTTI